LLFVTFSLYTLSEPTPFSHTENYASISLVSRQVHSNS
jgi:hypothetical protein